MALADIHLQRLIHERLKYSSFSSAMPQQAYRTIPLALPASAVLAQSAQGVLLRPDLSPTPFVPADPTQRAKHCREILRIQSTGLAKRLKHTSTVRVTIGLSGGLDSTSPCS